MEAEIDLLKGIGPGADKSPAGTVRVTSIPLVVNHILIPALKELYAAHPRLHIEAIPDPRNLSLTRRTPVLLCGLPGRTAKTRSLRGASAN